MLVGGGGNLLQDLLQHVVTHNQLGVHARGPRPVADPILQLGGGHWRSTSTAVAKSGLVPSCLAYWLRRKKSFSGRCR